MTRQEWYTLWRDCRMDVMLADFGFDDRVSLALYTAKTMRIKKYREYIMGATKDKAIPQTKPAKCNLN